MADETKDIIDLVAIARKLKEKKKTFFKIWAIVFVVSCIWIFPQPRMYECITTVAPEASESTPSGSLSAIASSFGINFNSTGGDALYPQIYPDIIESTVFLCELCDIRIQTNDGSIDTDYFDYMKNHQKSHILLKPFLWIIGTYKSAFGEIEEPINNNGKRFNSFRLTKDTNDVLKKIKSHINCKFSKTTEIITITVEDQDPLVCAIMCDSIKAHLQKFITDYRTKKARIDSEYYGQLLEQARIEYQKSVDDYAAYCDSHRDVTSTAYEARRKSLDNDMSQKLSIMNALVVRYEAARSKVQDITPAFTTILNSTVPVKPSSPKRLVFILAMLFLSTMVATCWLLKKELVEWF